MAETPWPAEFPGARVTCPRCLRGARVTGPHPIGCTVESRFWSKVRVNAVSGCWEWTGAKHGRWDYGKIGINGRTCFAHQVSWEWANGAIADDLSVLHRCDNPPCVRPDHLFVGTHIDNMRDMAAKARWGNRSTKLTEDQVATIRAERAAGVPGKTLAVRFGIGQTQVSRIVNGTRWRSVR